LINFVRELVHAQTAKSLYLSASNLKVLDVVKQVTVCFAEHYRAMMTWKPHLFTQSFTWRTDVPNLGNQIIIYQGLQRVEESVWTALQCVYTWNDLMLMIRDRLHHFLYETQCTRALQKRFYAKIALPLLSAVLSEFYMPANRTLDLIHRGERYLNQIKMNAAFVTNIHGYEKFARDVIDCVVHQDFADPDRIICEIRESCTNAEVNTIVKLFEEPKSNVGRLMTADFPVVQLPPITMYEYELNHPHYDRVKSEEKLMRYSKYIIASYLDRQPNVKTRTLDNYVARTIGDENTKLFEWISIDWRLRVNRDKPRSLAEVDVAPGLSTERHSSRPASSTSHHSRHSYQSYRSHRSHQSREHSRESTLRERQDAQPRAPSTSDPSPTQRPRLKSYAVKPELRAPSTHVKPATHPDRLGPKPATHPDRLGPKQPPIDLAQGHKVKRPSVAQQFERPAQITIQREIKPLFTIFNIPDVNAQVKNGTLRTPDEFYEIALKEGWMKYFSGARVMFPRMESGARMVSKKYPFYMRRRDIPVFPIAFFDQPCGACFFNVYADKVTFTPEAVYEKRHKLTDVDINQKGQGPETLMFDYPILRWLTDELQVMYMLRSNHVPAPDPRLEAVDSPKLNLTVNEKTMIARYQSGNGLLHEITGVARTESDFRRFSPFSDRLYKDGSLDSVAGYSTAGDWKDRSSQGYTMYMDALSRKYPKIYDVLKNKRQ